MALRRYTIAKEAVYVAIGITIDGTKEISGYTIVSNESSTVWKELFDGYKSKGLKRVLLICTDGYLVSKR